MPNLHLPFLLKSSFSERHSVARLFLLVNMQRVLTVSHQGDIIVWQIKDTVDSLESRLFLTPSLSHKTGELTAVTVCNKPLHFYTEGIVSCLLTVHRDNRLRMWNLEDGRCFNISQHGLFKTEKEIRQIQMLEMLNSDSRLLFCIGEDKKLMIIDVWHNELIKAVEVSKVNLVSFKLNAETSTIHFLNIDNEYSIWNIESYYKEEVNNYPLFVQNNQEKKPDALKSAKETLKHRIRLAGGNQDLPLNFISDAECPLFFVLLEDRILIYKDAEVCTEKDKVKSYITLNFVRQNPLQQFYLLSVKNCKYLVVITLTGNMTALRFKDILHLFELQESAHEELNFNHADFSFFKNISSNSAYLTIKPYNLIYQTDADILAHLKAKKTPQTLQISAMDSTTNTLLLYNPVEKSITLYDCELELQKLRRKIKLLDIPKSAKSKKISRLHHKTSLLLSSGKEKLNLLANNEEEGGENIPSEGRISDPNLSKYEPGSYKTMQGYLKHVFKENRKESVNEFLQNLFSNMFKEKILKNSNAIAFSAGKLINNEVVEELVTVTYLAYLKNGHLLYFLGTSQGNVYIFPFLFNYSWGFYPFYVYREKEPEPSPVRQIFVYRNSVFIEQAEGRIIVLEMLIESDMPESRMFFSKHPTTKEIESDFPGSIQEISLHKNVQAIFTVDSEVEEFRKLKTLKFTDDAANSQENYSFFKANSAPMAMILQNNNVVIYSVFRHQIELELKGNNATILGVFLHPYLDEILTFNSKGYLFIHNIPTGCLDRILSIENYSHLLNSGKFSLENFVRFNVHSYRKFLEIEDFQTSKSHFLIDYSLRCENYLLDYCVGRELSGKRSENHSNMKPVTSSNTMFGSALNLAASIELPENHLNNNSPSAISNITLSKIPSANIQETIDPNEMLLNQQQYERKKLESIGFISYERWGDFLQSLKKPEKEFAVEIAGLIDGKKPMVSCSNKDHGISLLTFNQHSSEAKKHSDTGSVVFFDAKVNLKNLKMINENELKYLSQPSYFSFAALLFPWGIDKEYDQKVLARIFHKVPVFLLLHGIQGVGESFTFLTTNKDKWAVSDYLSTFHACALLYFTAMFDEKELKIFTNYYLKIIEAFSKKKRAHEKINPCINLPLVCKFFLDSDGELMTAAYNLLISAMKNKDTDFNFVLQNSLRLYKLTSNDKYRPESFSYSHVIWSLMIGYTSVFYEKSKAAAEDCIKDVVMLTDIKNCIKTPNFVCGSLKLILDASHLLKNYAKEAMEFLDRLIYIYFIYYLCIEFQSQSSKDASDASKSSQNRMSHGSSNNASTTNDLKEVEKQRPEVRKTTKHIVSKAISAVGMIFIKEFLKTLKDQILNTNPHPMFPTAIIDIIRNFLKTQSPKQVHKFLHNFVEIILKTLDPNNPNLRKVCHKPSSQALHTIYKQYDMVSFHPTSQKFAIGTTENVIILYDLRTAVKWKVLEGHKGPISCMNFDNPGKYLASFSDGDSTLRIWKIGTTGFFSSILGMQGKHFKLFEIDKKKYLNEKLNTDLKFTLTWLEKSNHSSVSLILGERALDTFDIVE